MSPLSPGLRSGRIAGLALALHIVQPPGPGHGQMAETSPRAGIADGERVLAIADEIATVRLEHEDLRSPLRFLRTVSDSTRARWQHSLNWAPTAPDDPEHPSGLIRSLLLELLDQADAMEACPATPASPEESPPSNIDCYEGRLRASTALPLSPRAVYDIGVSMRLELEGIIAPLARRHLGVETSVEARAMLVSGEAYRFPSRDAMHRRSAEYLARARAAMPRIVRTVPDDSLELVSVPEEQGRDIAAAAYYNPARDGRPGRFFLNTIQAEARPRATAATAAFHEGWPGHHFQFARHKDLTPLHPALRGLSSPAFVEGWGLYSELLADELGLYDSPEDRIGYLLHMQDAMVALQVDAGLHAFGWTRAQAVDTMVTVGGRPPAQAEQYADRHLATPGQMVSYLIGYREILQLRDRARRRLGERFDTRDFHEALLAPGPLPLPAIRSSVISWLEGVASDSSGDSPPDSSLSRRRTAL